MENANISREVTTCQVTTPHKVTTPYEVTIQRARNYSLLQEDCEKKLMRFCWASVYFFNKVCTILSNSGHCVSQDTLRKSNDNKSGTFFECHLLVRALEVFCDTNSSVSHVSIFPLSKDALKLVIYQYRMEVLAEFPYFEYNFSKCLECLRKEHDIIRNALKNLH
jgi:hypothetical protein